jgi:hypothetical protein
MVRSQEGCTLPYSPEYNSSATTNDGSCTIPSNITFGCTYPDGDNFVLGDSVVEDGSCTFVQRAAALTLLQEELANQTASIEQKRAELEGMKTCRDRYLDAYATCVYQGTVV